MKQLSDKMIKKTFNKNNAKKGYIYIFLFIILVLYICLETSLYTIKIQYCNPPLNNYNNIIINTTMRTTKQGQVLSNESIKRNKFHYGIIRSSQWTRKGNNIDLFFECDDEQTENISIETISFRFLFVEVFCINGNNYEKIIASGTNISSDNYDHLNIQLNEKKAQLGFKVNDLIEIGKITDKIRVYKYAIISIFLIIMIALWFIDIKIPNNNYYKWILILLIISALVAVMSFYGMPDANPDERVSSEAIKYYYNNWGLPEYKSEEAKGAISNYGSSRLKELTPYYFIAGKIGAIIHWISGNEKAYRVFNYILFLFLCLTFILIGKENKWILFGIVITPQLWYLFSYATSDAWDYFICFLISIFLSVDKKIKRRNIFSIIRGLLFALLFMGKQNYYIVALFAFLIYLIELLFDSDERKQKIKEYSIILLTTVAIFFIRLLLDYFYYSGEKASILHDISKGYTKVQVIPMIKQGVNLSYLITETNLFDNLFKSFTGFYGSMTYESGKIYYFLCKILYITFFGYLGFHFYKMKDKKLMLQLTCSFTMIVIALFLVLYHCWTGDFQSQGRYIFGAIPCMMFLISRSERFYEGKVFNSFMGGMTILSLISFINYGMVNII